MPFYCFQCEEQACAIFLNFTQTDLRIRVCKMYKLLANGLTCNRVVVSHTTCIMSPTVTVGRIRPGLIMAFLLLTHSSLLWVLVTLSTCLSVCSWGICMFWLFTVTFFLSLSLSLLTTYQWSQSTIPTLELRHTKVTHMAKHTHTHNTLFFFTH